MSGKETKSLRKRRRMEFPDTYIILIGLCLLAVILTIVLPAGQYDREERNGRTVVVAGTFHEVEEDHSISILNLPVEIHKGFIAAQKLLVSCLLWAAVWGSLQKPEPSISLFRIHWPDASGGKKRLLSRC